jgi:hypothetical protein
LNRASRASGYLAQVLGNHLLMKQDPALRRAYDQLEQALLTLRDLVAPNGVADTTRRRTAAL